MIRDLREWLGEVLHAFAVRVTPSVTVDPRPRLVETTPRRLLVEGAVQCPGGCGHPIPAGLVDAHLRRRHGAS